MKHEGIEILTDDAHCPMLPGIVHPGKDLLTIMNQMVDTRAHQNPMYLCDESNLVKRVQLFLRSGFSGEVAYAVKANPNARVLRMIHRGGINRFDVASLPEIETVVRVYPDAHIMFNNPWKTPHEIAQASEIHGVTHFTVQTELEIRKILGHTKALPRSLLEIAVRLQAPRNQKALVDFHDHFGAPKEAVIEMIRRLKKEIEGKVGISVHAGSQNSDIKSYQTALETMADISKAVGGVDFLNIGGGFPVEYYPNPPLGFGAFLRNIVTIANRAKERARADTMYMEPGRSIVAESTCLVIPVVGRTGNDLLHIRDSVYQSFFSARLHRFEPCFRAFRKGKHGFNELPPDKRKKFVARGRTCDAADFLEVQAPEGTREGDVLLLPSAGAYSGASCSTTFNGFTAPQWIYYNTPS